MSSTSSNVLMVDDKPENLLALEAVLASPDYQLVRASTGHEAIQYLATHDCALVLLDVCLPEVDGFETATLMRQFESSRDTPILFITAVYLDHQHTLEGLAIGALDYLTKPFDPDLLRIKVRRLVQMHRRNLELLDYQRQQYQTLMMRAPIPITTTRGPQHSLELVNAQFKKLAGERPLEGVPVREALPELKGQGIFEMLDRVYSTGKPYAAKSVLACIHRPGEGPRLAMLDLVCQPWYNARGRMEGTVLFAADVSQTALVSYQLRRLSRQLEHPRMQSSA